MSRNEAKRIIALLWILVLLGWVFFHLIAFGPLLQDAEFDDALDRAEQIGIRDVDQIRERPFRFVTRKDAAAWYVAFAQTNSMILYSDDICTFNDIAHLPKDKYDMVMLSCGYRFFRWSQGGYAPDNYLTKSWSLVALMKWFYPTRDRWETEPYREPFVNQAYELGITKRESNEYMMYLIPKYELLLQLYRASKRK